jgi:hypothetical protein
MGFGVQGLVCNATAVLDSVFKGSVYIDTTVGNLVFKGYVRIDTAVRNLAKKGSVYIYRAFWKSVFRGSVYAVTVLGNSNLKGSIYVDIAVLGFGVRDSLHIDTAVGNSGSWRSVQMFYPLLICAIPIFLLIFSSRIQLMFLHPSTPRSKRIFSVSILDVCSSCEVGHSSPHYNVLYDSLKC